MLNKIKPVWYLFAGIILVALSHMSFSVNLMAWVAYTPFLIYLDKPGG